MHSIGIKKEGSGNVLAVRGLSVVLGKNSILSNVHFDIKKGEILGIIGVSGVGKTTLLRSIMNVYTPHKGDIIYQGKSGVMNPKDEPVFFKKFFGFSAQHLSFYPDLTVHENLDYFATLYDMPQQMRKQNSARALELVDMSKHASMVARKLSGGMQKRLDIACSIVHNPEILILDEPTSDLDPILRTKIWNVMKNINKSGTTIVVASHFLSEVEDMCDRIVFLKHNSVHFSGTPEQLREKYSHVRELHIPAKGSHELILKRMRLMPSLKILHFIEKKDSLIVHIDRQTKKTLQQIRYELNVPGIEERAPSMDSIFEMYAQE